MHEKGIGHFFMAIDPSRFMPIDQFKAAVNHMVQCIKSSPQASETEEILVPGELEHRKREASLQDGIPLAQATVDILRDLASECGREVRTK